MMNTSLLPAKALLLPTIILSSTLALSGCQSVKDLFSKRDNGSLDYQQSQKLAPLELPVAQQTAPFVPLYPTPNVGVNTLTLQNEAGKQYQLPMPQRAVPTTETPNN